MVWSVITGQRALQPFPSGKERRYVDDYPLDPALIKDGIPVLKVTKVRRIRMRLRLQQYIGDQQSSCGRTSASVIDMHVRDTA